MQYMLLIYDNEAGMKRATEGDQRVMMKAYREFTDSIARPGT